MIQDEPTTKQVYADDDNLFANMAFTAIYRDKDTDKAELCLRLMSSEKLDYLTHVCKKLLVLAEAELRMRPAGKAGQE